MELFEDPAPAPPPGNQPEYTVSELSSAVRRVIEGGFAHVRVRGEVGRVSRPASGHIYFDLKDERSVLAAICWRGQAGRLTQRPEEGMEVVATGRLTTFAGQSKYQLIVDDLAPAGAGALMAMLEKRRAALQAEGLFDPARKKPIPFLPEVIGVVTSPSGAVIRDILHRLADRFPRRVLIWPVAVQGERCAPEVAAAISGFNAIVPGGPVPRPDVIIVARGGGSLEDLWGFNEEIVVRAAAASRIPLISAVGHETDTTLIDHAADLRAPTPTAAAELAVPVRMELLAGLDGLSSRLLRAVGMAGERRRERLRDLGRALPRPEALTLQAGQRLDHAGGRLASALHLHVARRRAGFEQVAGRLRLDGLAQRLLMLRARVERAELAAGVGLSRRLDARRAMLGARAAQLAPVPARIALRIGQAGARLGETALRLEAVLDGRFRRLGESLAAVDRIRQGLGYQETLRRGFVVVRAAGRVVDSRAAAGREAALELEFRDGRLTVRPGPAGEGPAQGSLF